VASYFVGESVKNLREFAAASLEETVDNFVGKI
jgi:hypothetical protein